MNVPAASLSPTATAEAEMKAAGFSPTGSASTSPSPVHHARSYSMSEDTLLGTRRPSLGLGSAAGGAAMGGGLRRHHTTSAAAAASRGPRAERVRVGAAVGGAGVAEDHLVAAQGNSRPSGQQPWNTTSSAVDMEVHPISPTAYSPLGEPGSHSHSSFLAIKGQRPIYTSHNSLLDVEGAAGAHEGELRIGSVVY